jgi:hypothetical protein
MKPLTFEEKVALQMGDLMIKNLSLITENERLREERKSVQESSKGEKSRAMEEGT